MAYMKQLSSSLSSFLGLIVAFLLSNHLGVLIYVPPLIKSIWLNLISKKFTNYYLPFCFLMFLDIFLSMTCKNM